MATSSSSKIPSFILSAQNPTYPQRALKNHTNYKQRDSLTPMKRQSRKGTSLDLKLRKNLPSSLNLKKDGPELASSGVLIDELRNGSKILVPCNKSLHPDPLVQKIQIKLKELGMFNEDGTEIVADGHYSPALGRLIAGLRTILAEQGFEEVEYVDSKLIEYLFPESLRSNVEQRKVEVDEKNSTLGEFPDLIKEVQRLLNVHIPEAKLLENGKWSLGLEKRILEFKSRYLLCATARIDAATLKLLRGANLRELIASGDAVLQPGTNGHTPVVPFIKLLQPILNKYLKRELTVDGIFTEKTADVLEIAQKAAGIKERRVFGKESYDELANVLKDPKRRQTFYEQLKKINLAQELTINLGDEKKAASLNFKMNLNSPSENVPEEGILQSLEALGINIGSATGIYDFQRKRGIPVEGRIDQKTAQHLYEVLSAQWCKDKVVSLGLQWKENPNELNVIGLRGWSPEAGQNDNAENEWNDTIAFVWKDSSGRVRFREYTATTDPGVVEKDQNSLKKASENGIPCMEQGQYKYLQGYFNGRSGAAIPVNEAVDLSEQLKRGFFRNIKDRVKTYILGSHPFALHWMETSIGIDNIEQVGQLSLGAQVPKIRKSQFKKEITPLFKSNPGGYFLYTLIDMSR